MRITKSPEERKKEILEKAIEIFSKKGYEKTTMLDITKELNIAQGLIYKYFQSKEEVLECAIEEYAKIMTSYIKPSMLDNNLTLVERVKSIPALFEYEEKDSIYYNLYHNKNSRRIYGELMLKVCEKLMPILREQIEIANRREKLGIKDPDTVATFCLYGQQGIILRDDLSNEEKTKKIRYFLNDMFDKYI